MKAAEKAIKKPEVVVPKSEEKHRAIDDVVLVNEVISALDIETLSLSHNAVVIEIGVIFTNILPKPGTKWSLADLPVLEAFAERNEGRVFFYQKIILSVIEQILLGRLIDPSTVEFHRKLVNEREKISVEHWLREREVASYSIKAAKFNLTALFKKYAPVEVWMNHPSFDAPRVNSVLYDDAVNGLPWKHTAEYDVSSIKLVHREKLKQFGEKVEDSTKFPRDTVDESHDSLADCAYNLAVVSSVMFGG